MKTSLRQINHYNNTPFCGKNMKNQTQNPLMRKNYFEKPKQ